MAIVPEEFKTGIGLAVREGDGDEAERLTAAALERDVEPLDIVQQILVPTLSEVGHLFQTFQIFLPELMMAGEAAQRATALVEAATAAAGKPSTALGTVVIGTVEGDVHDIGKNIVIALLNAHGFKVVDLGREVTASAFVDAAQREKADIVGLSALMTTTLPAQRRTVSLFGELGLRGHVKLVVGGGAASASWATEIGADGYAADAAGAVALCKSLLGVGQAA